MPKINRKRDCPEAMSKDDVVAYLQEGWDLFYARAAWKRSAKGNIWRNWRGRTVSVFARDDRFFGWCIAAMDGKRFSQGALETEEEAVESLGFALGLNDLD